MAPAILTPRTAYRDAVAHVAAQAHEKLPESSGRIDAAVTLVLLGEVTLLPDGTAQVGSCDDPTRTYTVNGRCDCKDFARAPGQLCKHRLAYGIARRAQELTSVTLADTTGQPESPNSPAPLPEAPASVNCHITVADRQVQLTLRDTDETRLLQRLTTLLKQYPCTQSPTQSPGQSEGWCAKHNVQMKRTSKNGRSWLSHRSQDGWCYGR